MLSENSADRGVVDIKLPRLEGITVRRGKKKKHPVTEGVRWRRKAGLETARDAIRYGAFDYLLKPFDKDDILMVVEKGLAKRRSSAELKMERDTLLDRASCLERQIDEARSNIVMCYEGTVSALILTIDAKDHYTYNHSKRVAELSSLIAGELGVPKKTIKEIEHAASIHDIGKIGIEENILRKNGHLTNDEYEEIKKHPAIGMRIVQSVPFLEDAIPVILHHHERYDGRGYPEGISGERIPFSARIVIVADAVDAMMSARPYRNALTREKVMAELRNNAGTQFDPEVTDILLSGRMPLL